MVRLTALFVLLVSLVVGMSGASAQELVTGTVVRVDPAGIVYLGERKMLKTTMDSVFYAPTRPVAIEKLEPGTFVVVHAPADEVIVGTVARVDRSGVVLLDTGRMITQTTDTLIFAPTRPVAFRSLEPETMIVTTASAVVLDTRTASSPLVVSVSGATDLMSQGFGNFVKLPRALALTEPEYTQYALLGGMAAAGIRVPPDENEGVSACADRKAGPRQGRSRCEPR